MPEYGQAISVSCDADGTVLTDRETLTSLLRVNYQRAKVEFHFPEREPEYLIDETVHPVMGLVDLFTGESVEAPEDWRYGDEPPPGTYYTTVGHYIQIGWRLSYDDPQKEQE